MNNLVRKIGFLVICISLSGMVLRVHAQTAPFTRLDSLYACPGSQVTFPVTVENFTDIGAITLTIQYDSTVLVFDSLASSFHPLFSGGILNASSVGGGTELKQVIIVWSGLLPVTLPDSSGIATLIFDYAGGSTDLVFDNVSNGGTLCEYADSLSNPLTDVPTENFYQNGLISPLMPVSVTIVASDDSVCAGDSVTFTATPVNGGSNLSYQWKVNGLDQGSNSPVFIYIPGDGDQVTCVLTSSLPCLAGNPATSNQITITVHPPPITDGIWHN